MDHPFVNPTLFISIDHLYNGYKRYSIKDYNGLYNTILLFIMYSWILLVTKDSLFLTLNVMGER